MGASFGHNISRIPVYPKVPSKIQNQPAGAATGPTSALGPLQRWTTVERYPLRATVRRRQRAPISGPPPAAHFRSDAPPGEEYGAEAYRTLFERLGAPSAGPVLTPLGAATPESGSAAALEGPAPGTTNGEGEAAETPIKVPDIEIPALAELGKTDAVRAGFAYSGSITRGGALPTGFGVTRSFGSSLTGVTIAPTPGTFNVAATLEHPITYQIRSGTGPDGQVDIASETDADITQANYPTVVSNLTPNMGDLNGRPPRTNFWAEDLTVRHELVHANDDKNNGPGAMATVTTWLNSQTAANAGAVTTLLGSIPGRFAAALLAALSTVDGEKHAYGDGAPLYLARANAIKTKGDAGGYAPGSAPTGLSRGAKTGIGIGGGALVGAGIGALVGGPVGAGIGAGIGALVGGIGSLFF